MTAQMKGPVDPSLSEWQPKRVRWLAVWKRREVCVCVCECVKERGRGRETETETHTHDGRERKGRQRQRQRDRWRDPGVWGRDRHSTEPRPERQGVGDRDWDTSSHGHRDTAKRGERERDTEACRDAEREAGVPKTRSPMHAGGRAKSPQRDLAEEVRGGPEHTGDLGVQAVLARRQEWGWGGRPASGLPVQSRSPPAPEAGGRVGVRQTAGTGRVLAQDKCQPWPRWAGSGVGG